MKVFIGTLNFKGEKDTLELLESLRKVKTDGFEMFVLVVDNYPSSPIKVDESKYKELNLKVIYNSRNLGYSGGNNVAIKYALENGADYMLILNNDTTVDPSLVKELLKDFETNQKIGAVVPKIYFSKGFEFHKKYKPNELGRVIWYAGGEIDWANVIGKHRGVDEVDNGQYDTQSLTNLATGCAMMLKREVFEKVGLYDEKYFLYYEDADLSQRILKKGYEILYEPKAVVWHKNAQSTGGSGSEIQDYFISRNRLLFGLRYAPLRTKIALRKQSFKLLKSGRQWQKYGIQDYYRHRFGKGRMDL